MTDSVADYTVNISLRIFNTIYIPYLENESRTEILFGGSSSGKSKFLAQRCIYRVMKGGHNYLICRAIAKDSRRSTFVEVSRVIEEWGVGDLFRINQTDMTITCENNYQILFTGLDDLQKIKSIAFKKGALTDIWIEEATQIERNDLKELYKRQRGGDKEIKKQVTLSFNPILQSHWIYTEFFNSINWADEQKEYKSDRLCILKTIYKDNRFLTQDDIDDLENETDKYYYDVYTLGKWGVLGNVIFTNWRVEDLSEMCTQFVNRRTGLDFGFSTDPAAMPVTHYDKKNKTIYIFKELYEFGLTNDLLAEEVIKLIGKDRVVCDSAEPKSIAELKALGINAIGAVKGKDSVLFGIQWLQQQSIIIDVSCIHSRNEIMQYKWKEDKNGIAMRQPLEKNDHIIDGLRYAYEDDMERKPSIEDMIGFAG